MAAVEVLWFALVRFALAGLPMPPILRIAAVRRWRAVDSMSSLMDKLPYGNQSPCCIRTRPVPPLHRSFTAARGPAFALACALG